MGERPTAGVEAERRGDRSEGAAAKPPVPSPAPVAGQPVPPPELGKPSPPRPDILGGAFDPVYEDKAPSGGLLVGLEIGFDKFVHDDTVRYVRPIYRAGDKESFGASYGSSVGPRVTLKAGAGYAVGAINGMPRLGCDGLALTFMRVKGDRLDPADAYESEWAGWKGAPKPTKLGGDGTPVVGIILKKNDRHLTGIGVLFRGK